MSIIVRDVLPTEINQVVEIHKNAFEDFFLTKLGSHFLETYYSAFFNAKDGILLGCYQDDKLLGFMAATTLSRGFNKRLIKNNFFHFVKAGLILLFKKPFSLIRLYKNAAKTNGNEQDDGNYAELLSCGVNKNEQGKGIGQRLFDAAETKIKSMNPSVAVSMTTDYYNNEKTLLLYKKIGYEIMYEFVAYPNRKMYRLIKL